MPNALQGLPPAPQQDAGQAQQQAGAPQQPQQAPAPSHAQVVAALRHFSAVQKELGGLLKNPDLGKADIKSAIIDGATKLVADRIISAPSAVSQLATVPEKPLDQRKWVEQHYAQIVQAQAALLDHHRASTPGTGHYELDSALNHGGSSDDHMETMSGMMKSHYGGPRA